jgi:hypothetical protein
MQTDRFEQLQPTAMLGDPLPRHSLPRRVHRVPRVTRACWSPSLSTVTVSRASSRLPLPHLRDVTSYAAAVSQGLLSAVSLRLFNHAHGGEVAAAAATAQKDGSTGRESDVHGDGGRRNSSNNPSWSSRRGRVSAAAASGRGGQGANAATVPGTQQDHIEADGAV